MNKPLFALVDCNNFFVSCERVFRPDLEGKPVVVLSSNDGCAVARSNEVKALGIPMGAPAFKYREVFRKHDVIQFSANFELYGDMSRRITHLLTSITPRTEIYSVDESFLDLSQLHIQDYTEWGRNLRESIWRWTGVPVSVGIAPSKTLAKLASERAKKDPELNGVLSLASLDSRIMEYQLASLPIQDVWGIGWRLAPKMRAEGISNALHLSQLRPQHAQQLMGIRGRQLVAELNGISCFPLELEGKAPKSILRSRTFGEDTSDPHVMEAAIANFATQATFRLRHSDQLARQAGIFVDTNKHKPGFRRWNRAKIYKVPTADTGQVIADMTKLFREFYNPNQSYHRAGVWLGDFVPAGQLQSDLLGYVDVPGHSRAHDRMAAVDQLNERFGKRTVRFAAELLAQSWQPKYKIRSPRYTTHLADLPTVKIVQ